MSIRDGLLEGSRDTYLRAAEHVAPEDAIRAGGFSPLDPIDCVLGCGQWGTSPLACAALASFDPRALAAYPERFHETLLAPAVLERFCAHGVREDQLFFGHGSFNLLERIVHKLVRPGRMLGVGPQFGEVPFEWKAAGGTYEALPLVPPDYALPLDALEHALDAGAVSIVYVDNPNNPLGRHFPADEMDAARGVLRPSGRRSS